MLGSEDQGLNWIRTPAERTCDRFVLLLRWHWGDMRGAPPRQWELGRQAWRPPRDLWSGRMWTWPFWEGHWDSAHRPTTQAEAPPGESASPVGQLESPLSLLPAGAPLPPCPQGTPCPGHALPRQPQGHLLGDTPFSVLGGGRRVKVDGAVGGGTSSWPTESQYPRRRDMLQLHVSVDIARAASAPVSLVPGRGGASTRAWARPSVLLPSSSRWSATCPPPRAPHPAAGPRALRALSRG